MALLTEEERQAGYHVFIGRDISEGYKSLNDEDVWDGKLLLRSWFQVLTMLNQFDYTGEYGSFIKWSMQIRNLLHKLNIVSYNGFKSISTNEVNNYHVNLLNLFQYRMNDDLINKIANNFDTTLCNINILYY